MATHVTIYQQPPYNGTVPGSSMGEQQGSGIGHEVDWSAVSSMLLTVIGSMFILAVAIYITKVETTFINDLK